MKNLYLIRHGETELNKAKVYYGATDCPLTDKGREQSRGLQAVFAAKDIDLIYVSPLQRAKETADIIFSPSLPRVIDPRLQEMDFGSWEGKRYTELSDDPIFQLWQEEWESTRAPGGESFNDLAQRVESFCLDLKNTKADNVALVGHNAVLMLILPTIFSLTREQGWHFCFQQGCYSQINYAGDYPVLKALNREAVAQPGNQ